MSLSFTNEKEVKTFRILSNRLARHLSNVRARVDKLKLRAIGQYCNLEKAIDTYKERERDLKQTTSEASRVLEQCRCHNASLERCINEQQLYIETLES